MTKTCKIATKALIIMLFGLFVFIIFLNSNSQNAIASSNPFAGVHGSENAGSESNPFAISTIEHLETLSEKVNEGNSAYNDKYYQLTNHIIYNEQLFDESGNVLENSKCFTPIGLKNSEFRGHFNGNGYTIKGLYVDTPNASLFGYTNGATIYNLGLVDGYFKSDTLASSFVYNAENSKIINCYNTSKVSAMRLGGIACNVKSNSCIVNCYNLGELNANSNRAGGIAYSITVSTIENSYYFKTNDGEKPFYAYNCGEEVTSDEGSTCANFDEDGYIQPESEYLWEKLNQNIDNLDYNLDFNAWQQGSVGQLAIFASGNDLEQYVINHYTQDIASDTYTLIETEHLTGVTGENTQAKAKEFEGFTAQSFDQQPITAEGNTVIDIYYIRNSYKGSFKLTQGEDGTIGVIDIKYGQELTQEFLSEIIDSPTRQGYTFSNWHYEYSSMPACDITIYGNWQVNIYTITYNSKSNGGLDDDITKEFEYGQEVDLNEIATKEDYQFLGWNTDQNATESLQSFSMPHYDITLYAIFSKEITISYIDTETTNETYILYNNDKQSITFAEIEKFDDFIPLGWTNCPNAFDHSYTFGETIEACQDITFYAVYEKDIEISFIVGDNTEQKQSETVYYNAAGKYSKITLAEIEEFDNFTPLGWINDPNAFDHSYTCGETLEVCQDTTFFAVYKKDIGIRIIVDDNTEFEQSATVYYNASRIYEKSTFNLPEAIEKIGYTFDKWHTEETEYEYDDVTQQVTTVKSMEFIAIYTPNNNTEYIVKHYTQDIASDTYTLIETEHLTGVTGENTQAKAKEFEGFTAQSFDQQPITAEGNTVIDIYYIRNSYKGSFKLTQGEDGTIGVIDIKYGQELTPEFFSAIIDNPTRQGYEFLGWDCVYASMPAFEINIYAKWQAKDVTFKLSIYLESLSGNGEYDWDTVSTKTAKAGSSYTYEENCQSLQRDGFILLEFDTVIIDGDGSTEIEIYYKRNKYTVTYLVRNDAFYEQELFYEQEINFDNVNTPNVPGYNFENWECKYENMPSKNIEALAILSLKEPVVENSQLNMEKVYDGIDLCICIEVSHDLENIEYKWYKGDEIICQDKELKLKDVCQSGTYYLVATIRDGENCCHKRSDDIVVEISKAQVDLSQVSFLNKEVTYDGNCHEIVIDGYLPNEVRVTYENNSGIEIGEYRAKAIFEVGDNYSPIAPMEAVLNIIAKPKGNPIDENDSKEDKELEQNCKNRITLTSDDLCKDSLSLEVADCTISMCKASLESLKNKALSSPIALAVDKVEKEDLHIPNFLQPEKSEIYNLALFVGDEQVEFLERVEISIPYTLDNNAKLQVWQWQNNEFKEISGVTYQDGYVNFVADGLSYIVIGVESQDQAPTIANDVLLMTGCLSIIGLIIISVIIIKSVKKKKTK